jgi:protein-L-isoaspartate(D-aspartate) O-methyltransferase
MGWVNLIRSGNSAKTFEKQRRRMVEHQLRGRGIHSAGVLDAMLAVPRHDFVPAACRAESYSDQALPISFGQTISQPLMVAAMTESLALTGSERVLEIGTGSGYQTAVLAHLAAEVCSIEYQPELVEAARERLACLGCQNVRLRKGDGGLGWPESAPFDAIIVTAAAPAVPPPLLDQLAEGGRMVIPVGGQSCQQLLFLQKRLGRIERRKLEWCRFVPLLGIHGWGRPLRG